MIMNRTKEERAVLLCLTRLAMFFNTSNHTYSSRRGAAMSCCQNFEISKGKEHAAGCPFQKSKQQQKLIEERLIEAVKRGSGMTLSRDDVRRIFLLLAERETSQAMLAHYKKLAEDAINCMPTQPFVVETKR